MRWATRERCAEAGRPYTDIDRTVVMDALIRDTAGEAEAAFARTRARHGLAEVPRSDGTECGLAVGGPPASVAEYVRRYEAIGVSEVMWIFRDPFDRETIDRLTAVRAALG